MLSDSYVSLPLSEITASLTDYWYITPTKCGKVKSKTRVTSYDLQDQIHELQAQIHKLRVQIYELRELRTTS